MTCATHNWWFDTHCPKCALPEITAAVTKTAPEPAPRELNAPSGVETPETAPEPAPEDPDPLLPPSNDQLEIPTFLRRNPDNTLKEPAPWSELKPLKEAPVVEAKDVRALSDAELKTALYSEMPIADRQPFLQEATRRENLRKTHERLDKAGFLKSKGGDPSPE